MVLNPPHHTHNHAHKGTHNPPTSLFVVTQCYMVLISAQTYGCSVSSVLGGECNRVGFTPLGYPSWHRSQDPPTHNIPLGCDAVDPRDAELLLFWPGARAT